MKDEWLPCVRGHKVDLLVQEFQKSGAMKVDNNSAASKRGEHLS